ncbi:MAG: VWA domain-containing protein [Rickettsiales bacterium]|nr:VWA domain-containing protein [Rickettsiales bacterium]
MKEVFENIFDANFHFEKQDFLWLCLLGLLFICLEFFPGRRLSFSLEKLRKFIDKPLIKHLLTKGDSKYKLVFNTIIISIVWLLLVVAIANPRWDYTDIEAFRPDVNIVFLVDVSNSMNADDEMPSRLTRVKQEIFDITNNISSVNYALVAYSHNASVITPLTDDEKIINYYAGILNTNLMPIQGSNIEAGLDVATNLLSKYENAVNYIILMSDGEFTSQIPTQKLTKIKEKINLVSYGFGTLEGSPIRNIQGDFIREKGKLVISKINAENLFEISGEEKFIKANYLEDDVKKLKSFIDGDIIKQESKYKSLRVWNNRFYIPLALAMIILAFYFRKGASFPVILILISFPYHTFAENISEENSYDELKFENIFSWDFFKNRNQIAENRFKTGKYSEAKDLFLDDYNKGVAAYKQRSFFEAEKFFSNALENNSNALYNLANSQLKQLKAEESIENYKKFLEKNPNHQKAKTNLEIAQKILQQQQISQSRAIKEQENEANLQSEENAQKQSETSQDDNQEESNSIIDQELEKIFGSKNDDKTKQNSSQNVSNALKLEAEKLFQKISGEPSQILKNRIYLEHKNQKNINEKPW